MNDDENLLPLSSQIDDLQLQHRTLDNQITHMQAQPYCDQIELQRLKKQKLRLKDRISYLRSLMIPDWDA